MKAVQLTAPGSLESHPLRYGDVDDPAPGQGQVLLRVISCGVCRSNLHMIEGDWVPNAPTFTPIIPGHEVIGEIVAVGAGVDDLAVGDKAGVMPLWSTCRHCEYCNAGIDELCQSKEITGETVNGGYAELMVATAYHTYKIPDSLAVSSAAPFFCPGITAYGSVKKAHLEPGKSVAVFGVGGVGHVALQFAGLTGADTVAVSRGRGRLELAERLGAGRVVDNSSGDAADQLQRTGGVDAALVFAPSDEVVASALASLKPGGMLILGVNALIGSFGFAMEQHIVGSILGTRADMRQVIEIAASGRIHIQSEERPLADAERALADLKAGTVAGRLVLVP
jgi:alcohol dehydrogenase, propanol-preferring